MTDISDDEKQATAAFMLRVQADLAVDRWFTEIVPWMQKHRRRINPEKVGPSRRAIFNSRLTRPTFLIRRALYGERGETLMRFRDAQMLGFVCRATPMPLLLT